MIQGIVKTINVTSSDLELIDFLLTSNEKVAKTIPDSDRATREHMGMLHTNLRQVLTGAK